MFLKHYVFSRNFRLSRNFTLLLCFSALSWALLSFSSFFLLASYSFSFFTLSFHLLSFSLSCCSFLVSFPCSIYKHSALVSNLAFGLDHFDRLTGVTCGVWSTNTLDSIGVPSLPDGVPLFYVETSLTWLLMSVEALFTLLSLEMLFSVFSMSGIRIIAWFSTIC